MSTFREIMSTPPHELLLFAALACIFIGIPLSLRAIYKARQSDGSAQAAGVTGVVASLFTMVVLLMTRSCDETRFTGDGAFYGEPKRSGSSPAHHFTTDDDPLQKDLSNAHPDDVVLKGR